MPSHIVVRVSTSRYVVAEPDPAEPGQLRAITRPLARATARDACRELNEVEVQDWSEATRAALIDG